MIIDKINRLCPRIASKNVSEFIGQTDSCKSLAPKSICPRSTDPIYIVTYYIYNTTSWTDSIHNLDPVDFCPLLNKSKTTPYLKILKLSKLFCCGSQCEKINWTNLVLPSFRALLF